LSINFSSDEILVLSLSLKLYYSLLCGRVEILNELFEGLNINFSTILLVEKLKDNRDLFTNLIDKNIPFDISSNYIYYKAKWAWDIYNVLENNVAGKIGSIPLIKIEEISDSRRFRY
jgi:glutaredoxin-related protein